MPDNKLIVSLIENAQGGNNSAFENLFQMSIDKVYALLLRLSGSSAAASELTTKTYVEAWQKISQKDPEELFNVWLKKVAVDTLLANKKIVKDSGKQKTLSAHDQEFFGNNTLEGNIQKLELMEKVIYVLHDIEKFDIEEIAKKSDKSIEEVKNSLVDCRNKLISLA
jgi:DNA-directed RNA polymerase specialized sigma24 family protein